MSIKIFNPIKIDIPYKEIYARLGYAHGKTKITPEQEKEIEKYISEAQNFLRLKGAALRVPLAGIEGKNIKFGHAGNGMFRSSGLAELFKNSKEVLFMGATGGADIIKEIQESTAGKNVTRGVVLDSVASEMADACLDWIQMYYNRELRREGKYLTSRRFSCGYGDFNLENQRIMWDTLKLKELGVDITENCLLVPEKSVTAVAGIEPVA